MIEAEALNSRSLSDRIGDAIASRLGRMSFAVVHLAWFLLWITINGRIWPLLPPFDPFPFSLLTLIVSLESILISIFILMSQTRAGRQADRRNHLDLQINLLAEHENTKMLQMLQAICAHHGLRIGADKEVVELSKRTEPQELLENLEKHLPDE